MRIRSDQDARKSISSRIGIGFYTEDHKGRKGNAVIARNAGRPRITFPAASPICVYLRKSAVGLSVLPFIRVHSR
jgi:hypothetical protein